MKTIVQFGHSPSLFLDLVDRSFSLFIDPDSGNIFLDEGVGDDRINGAVLFGQKNPLFEIENKGESVAVWVHYCKMSHLLGETTDSSVAHDWVYKANILLSGDPFLDDEPESLASQTEAKNALVQLCIEKTRLFTQPDDSLSEKERQDKEIVTLIASGLIAIGVFAFAYVALKLTGASTDQLDQDKVNENKERILASLSQLGEETKSSSRSKSESQAIKNQIKEARQLMESIH